MNKGRILVVDDNPINLKLIKVLLISHGFNIKTALNAKEASILIEEFKPHLILMDIQLPDIDGLEFTRQLKSIPKTSSIIIIALTAYAMKGDDLKAKSAGCDDYVTKPIEVKTLPSLIEKHLSKADLDS